MAMERRPGRPRESRVDVALLQATRELLAERGYERLTVDAVAARGGVGKAAIYRRYGSKAEMVFAATVHALEIEPPADTGSLEGDLRALAGTIAANTGHPAALQVAPALIAELAHDPGLATRFQEVFLSGELAVVEVIAQRALRRGELDHPPDPMLVNLLLIGPIFAALFAYHLPVDDALLDGLAALVAAGLTS